MNKKKVSVFLIIIGILLIVVGFVLNTNSGEKPKTDPVKGETPPVDEDIANKTIDQIMTKEKTEKDVKNFTNKIFDSNVKQDDLTKLTYFVINYNDIYYGKDTYFKHLNDNLSGVDDINKKRDQYVSSLEKLIKDNFELKINDYSVSQDGAVVQNVTFKSYYYTTFLLDYFSVVNKLTSYTKYANAVAPEDGKIDPQVVKDTYILNVKALEIMSPHFSDYINNEEYEEFSLIYRKESNVISNEYFSFYKFIGGSGYQHTNLPDANRNARVDAMIQEAINGGTLDVNDPFILK